MTTYIVTKDVAKLVRAELKAAFPGVPFSVRCSTGTASAWMNVTWTDGPTTRQVDAITGRFEGRKFNGMTDGYDDQGTVLIAGTGQTLPEEVRYCCDGINTHRDYSPAGHLEAQRIITTDSSIPDIRISDQDGTLIRGNLVGPDRDVIIGGHVFPYPWMDAHQAVHTALRDLDLSPATRTA